MKLCFRVQPLEIIREFFQKIFRGVTRKLTSIFPAISGCSTIDADPRIAHACTGEYMPTQEPALGLRDRISLFKRAMTAEEVSELFGVNLRTIYNRARDGEIPSFRIGTAIRFDPKKLLEWYESL